MPRAERLSRRLKIRVKRRKGNLLADGWQIALRQLALHFLALCSQSDLRPLVRNTAVGRAGALSGPQSRLAADCRETWTPPIWANLRLHLSRDHLLAGAGQRCVGLTVIEFLAMILLVGGTIRIYLAGEPPRLPVLLARGSEYFWRMVRVSLLFALIAGLVLGWPAMGPRGAARASARGLRRTHDVSLLRRRVPPSFCSLPCCCACGSIWSRSTRYATALLATAVFARQCCPRSGSFSAISGGPSRAFF